MVPVLILAPRLRPFFAGRSQPALLGAVGDHPGEEGDGAGKAFHAQLTGRWGNRRAICFSVNLGGERERDRNDDAMLLRAWLLLVVQTGSPEL